MAAPAQPQRISLGAAFGFPAADGHYVPHENLPDTWLVLFLKEHANGEEYYGLFCSCRAGRDFALTRAPHATLTLDTTTTQPTAFSTQALRAAQRLLTRGDLPVTLKVLIGERDASAGALAMLPGALLGAGKGVTHLRLRHYSAASVQQFAVSSGFIQGMAVACPNLEQIKTNGTPLRLPWDPELLLKLKRLIVSGPFSGPEPNTDAALSVARYLPQLDTLVLHGYGIDRGLLWPVIFTSLSTSQTLYSLTIDGALSDELVRLLLDHAPNLAHLNVGWLELFTDGDSLGHKEWGVTSMNLSEPGMDVAAEQLACLPKTKGDGLRVTISNQVLSFTAMSTQGLSSELHEFMKSIAICCLDEVALWADSDILETDQAAALCAALRQMRDLAIWDTYTDATHTTVYLEGWALSGALLRDADETLRSLATARYSVHTMEPLHDELLGAILGLGNRVGWVTAAGFYTPDGPAPPAAEYANTPWPWEELKVGMFDVGALLRLPDPGGVPRVVCAKECAFFRSGVDCDAVRQRLQNIVWRKMPIFVIVSLQQFVTSQLSLMTEFRVQETDNDTADSPPKYELWVMPTRAVQEFVDGLRQLPDVPGILNLRPVEEWVLEPSAYAQLAQTVPRGFDTWQLPNDTPEAVKAAIQAGLAASNRTVTIDDS